MTSTPTVAAQRPIATSLLGGRYELLLPAGSGRYTDDWVAYDTLLQRDVVVRVIGDDYVRTAAQRNALRNAFDEISALRPASLAAGDVGTDDVRTHSILDWGRDRTGSHARFFVVSDVESRATTLRDHLTYGRRWTPSDAMGIADRLCCIPASLTPLLDSSTVLLHDDGAVGVDLATLALRAAIDPAPAEPVGYNPGVTSALLAIELVTGPFVASMRDQGMHTDDLVEFALVRIDVWPDISDVDTELLRQRLEAPRHDAVLDLTTRTPTVDLVESEPGNSRVAATPPTRLPNRKRRRVRKLAVTGAALGGLWYVAAPAALGGFTTYTVVAGTSMEPTFHTGDLVVSRPRDRYRVGDVVTYTIPDEQYGKYNVVHRIIGTRSDGRHDIQGDNRDAADPWLVSDSDIHGRKVLLIGRAGYALVWLRSPIGLSLIVGMLVTLYSLDHLKGDADENDEKREANSVRRRLRKAS